MLISISKPDAVKLDKFLHTKKDLNFSYPEVGATGSENPKGYDIDHNYIFLGKGDMVWGQAKLALQNWKHFPTLWTKIYDDKTPLRKGNTVAVLFRLFGFWWINPARIVYTFDENDRFGFAYGTLQGHVESGEECFWLEKDREGEIYYYIKAFSKPAFGDRSLHIRLHVSIKEGSSKNLCRG